MKGTGRQQSAAHGGMVVLIVLIVLGLACLLLVAVVRDATIEHRRVREYEHERQVESLAAAGVERGRARLARDPNFVGETWSINAAELPGGSPGTVAIDVSPVAGLPQRRRIRARGVIAAAGSGSIQHSQEVIIEMP